MSCLVNASRRQWGGDSARAVWGTLSLLVLLLVLVPASPTPAPTPGQDCRTSVCPADHYCSRSLGYNCRHCQDVHDGGYCQNPEEVANRWPACMHFCNISDSHTLMPQTIISPPVQAISPPVQDSVRKSVSPVPDSVSKSAPPDATVPFLGLSSAAGTTPSIDHRPCNFLGCLDLSLQICLVAVCVVYGITLILAVIFIIKRLGNILCSIQRLGNHGVSLYNSVPVTDSGASPQSVVPTAQIDLN